MFLNNAASGATLGYYGTLLGTRGQRMTSYWVYVPALDQVVKVPAANILLIGPDKLEPISEVESAWQVANQKWEIEFECPLEPDNSELRGTYRIGSQLTGKFHFVKRNQSHPTYQFAIPAQGNVGRGKLKYVVPADCALNREVVMHALSEILGVELPPTPTT